MRELDFKLQGEQKKKRNQICRFALHSIDSLSDYKDSDTILFFKNVAVRCLSELDVSKDANIQSRVALIKQHILEL